MYSFSYLEPVCCSMSSSNCCFLTCIQISQEAGEVVWYSHFFQNFPQFVVIHTVKGFGIVNKAEIDVFLDSLAFLMIQRMLAIWSLVPLPFLKPAWTSLIIRELQIKITMRCHLTPVRMATIKKFTNNKRQGGCGTEGTLLQRCWKCKLVQPLRRTVWGFL